MDKKTLTGFVLIGIVITAYMFYVSINSEKQTAKPTNDTTLAQVAPKSDSVIASPQSIVPDSLANSPLGDSLLSASKYGATFAPKAVGEEKIIKIETEFLKISLSSKGASIIHWELKKYQNYDSAQVQLIKPEKGNYYINLISQEGKKIDTRDLYFDFVGMLSDSTKLKSGENVSFSAKLDLGNGKSIVKEFKFYGDKYYFDSEIKVNNLDQILPQQKYNLVWSDGLPYQEKIVSDESSEAHALVVYNDDFAEFDATPDEKVQASETGLINYATIKLKYFATTIIPYDFDGTVDISGVAKYNKDHDAYEEVYDMSFRVPYTGGTQSNKFRVFIGPLEYDLVSELGIDRNQNYGWGPIRYIGQYFMVPIFRFVHYVVPNYGIALILFALLMKFLLYPLSITQMKSAQKMKILAPEIEKVREKYKDDYQKQQTEMMSIYSTYGVNPASGCLPLLLQMPILYALWTVLRNNIELRQADFILWITDLSQPDSILDFGFSILGMSALSGLALAMSITMFIQQKQSMTDPRQKAMLYIMPVMFLFMFSHFPSGLNLYYFMFNIFSILHQYWLNNYSKNMLTLEQMRQSPKKEGWLQKKMKEAQQMAESQGKTMPKYGQINQNPKKNDPKKKK